MVPLHPTPGISPRGIFRLGWGNHIVGVVGSTEVCSHATRNLGTPSESRRDTTHAGADFGGGILVQVV